MRPADFAVRPSNNKERPKVKRTQDNLEPSKEEALLSGLLQAKIEISNKKNNSGHIKILFKTKKDSDRIIETIKSSEIE